jgi:hypothetical protein
MCNPFIHSSFIVILFIIQNKALIKYLLGSLVDEHNISIPCHPEGIFLLVVYSLHDGRSRRAGCCRMYKMTKGAGMTTAFVVLDNIVNFC